MNDTFKLYSDGGVIGKNPSRLGGTWAFCVVDGKELVEEQSGFVTPEDVKMSRVTNNLTELVAAVYALEFMPADWAGTLYLDSKLTLNRLCRQAGFKGIPDWLWERAVAIADRRAGKIVLVAGHPNRNDLFRGTKKGKPVSKWNEHCDRLCCNEARKFLATPHLQKMQTSTG